MHDTDIRYLVDKLISISEGNIGIQQSTLERLMDIRASIAGSVRDHTDLKEMIQSVGTELSSSLSGQQSIDKCMNELLIRVTSIMDMHETLKQGMVIIGIVVGMFTLINFAFSMYLYFAQSCSILPF